MEKCRICLVENKRAKMCIYESNKNVSYANMMIALANITIKKHDGITDKICRPCRKLLQDAYDLKLLIESSDATLNGHTKKITFNNINDIKMQVEIEIDEKKPIKKHIDVVNFITGKNKFGYGDTAISKVRIDKPDDDICLKPIPVLEFLKTIQDEPDNDNCSDYDLQDYDGDSYGVDSDDDGDYIPPDVPLSQRVTRTTRNTKRKSKYRGKKYKYDAENHYDEINNLADKDFYGTDTDCEGAFISPEKLLKKRNYVKKPPQKSHQVCIKPIRLKNLKLVYSHPKRFKTSKVEKRVKEKSVCPHCGILTQNLKSHILLHSEERKFKCDKCDKAYFQQAGLTAHQKARHEAKLFKCNECTAAFSIKASLESHMVKHTGELKFVCDICNKAFKRRSAMQRHRMRHNTANKNVQCEQCNMSFYTKSQLRHHLRIHTGERPYNCEMCSQPYSYKRDFNRHCLKKHGLYLNHRAVYVMNEEVMKRERLLMKELVLRVQGVIKDGKPLNPFESEGGQASLAFESAIEAIEARQIPIDFTL